MPRRKRRSGLTVAIASILLLTAAPAFADEYESDEAGHPLRIAAYVLHPIGWFLDYFISEPLHKIGNSPPGRVIFGHEGEVDEIGMPEIDDGAAAEPEPSSEDSEI